MKILKNLYYLLFETLILLFISLSNKNHFLILTPRPFSFLIKRVIIFNLKKKKFFLQYVRNFYDINTVFQIFGYGEYNLSTLKIWNKIFTEYKKHKNSTIIDCGANIGTSSRYLSEIFNKSDIYSIEPNYDNFRYLNKNLNGNNINCIKSAIASKNFNFKMINKKDTRAHRISLGNKSKKKNMTITINDILNYKKKNWPFIIKIDIEGSEKDLFESNIQWMDKFKIIIIEIHDWMLPSQDISTNFIYSLTKSMKKNKRDLILKGENLISIKYN